MNNEELKSIESIANEWTERFIKDFNVKESHDKYVENTGLESDNYESVREGIYLTFLALEKLKRDDNKTPEYEIGVKNKEQLEWLQLGMQLVNFHLKLDMNITLLDKNKLH